jgi:hypothetical protein
MFEPAGLVTRHHQARVLGPTIGNPEDTDLDKKMTKPHAGGLGFEFGQIKPGLNEPFTIASHACI